MSRHRVRLIVPALLAVAALLAFGATAAVAKPIKITGKQSTITPSAASKAFLQNQGITVSPVNGATIAGDGSVTLAITGGRARPKTLNGYIRHKGGLKFTKGKRSATLTQFVLVKAKRGVWLTAVGRVQVRCKRAFRRGHVAANNRGRRVLRKLRRILRRHHVQVRCFANRRIVVAHVVNPTRTDSGNTVTLKGDLKLSREAARLINRATGASVNAGAPLGSGVSEVTYSVS